VHVIIDRLRTEHGSIIPLVALLLLFIIALIALPVEVGNWYEHRGHLQLQVEAAALAGGGLFGDCLSVQNAAAAGTLMENVADQYVGVTSTNQQVGGSAGRGSLARVYESNTFPPPSSQGPDDTVAGNPCASGMFDVKATEADIPKFLAFSPLATVHAHARVALRQLNEARGLLPMAVPDVRVNYIFATFINESTGNPIAGCRSGCTVQLRQSGVLSGKQLWTTQAPLNVRIAANDVGVRMRLVGGADPSAPCTQLYTECYDAASANGLIHIRGWDPSATAPTVHNAWLLAGNCSPDAYFTTADCSAGLQAEVDLGSDHPLAGAGITVHVSAAVDGGGQYQLTPGGGGGLVTWTATGGIPVSGPGPHPVTLGWSWEQTQGIWNGIRCRRRAVNRCTDSGTFGTPTAPIQRAFEAGVDNSGPLQLVQVFESGISTSGANSFQRRTTHALGVTVATTGNLSLSPLAANEPAIKLRVTVSSGGGRQTQSIDCDPNQPSLRDEIANGCAPLYAINPGTSCPAYNQLWVTLQPWNCVKTEPGGNTSQVAQGLKDRILGGSNSCTAPNNWPNFAQTDPRIVPLIITPFGTFSGSGSAVVPVINFGAFYLVGWNGDPCSGDVSVPRGYIAGHFVKYIPQSAQGSGNNPCDLVDPNQITPCVPVLTR
jgi:hypothetical protein